MPKAGQPRTKTGHPSSAVATPTDAFRRAGRRLTRRIVRKRVGTRIRRTGISRTQTLAAFTALATKIRSRELKAARDSLTADRYEARTVESSSSQPASASDNVRSNAGADNIASAAADNPPDVSLEFRSEMGALLAFYAARISAVRRSLHRTTADVIILAIVNEQAVALRALTDRWHAASQRQRDEKTERPTGNAQRQGDDLKPS